MTDEQILADQRAEHGNPYMPLSVAKEMQRFDRRWAHDDALHKKRAREGTLPVPSRAVMAIRPVRLIGRRHRDR